MDKYQAYPEYNNSGIEWIGNIPSDWNVLSLKRTVDGCTNGIWGSEPDGKSDIAVLRVADFDRTELGIREDKLTYRSVLPRERDNRLLQKGDLLIEKSGGGEKTLVGCVVLFDKDFPAVTSNFVAKMTPKRGFDSRFLKYAFALLYSGRVNFPSIKQTTGIQNLDSDAYLMEQFCFPEELEQVQIANFLDHETAKIDTLIEKQQQLIKLLKEKRHAVISHAVTKGLNPQTPMQDSGVEWLGEVPEHWRPKSIKRLFKQRKQQNNDGYEVLSVYREFGVILKSSRSDNHNKTPDDLSSYQLVNKGCLVINKMKAWQGSLGVSDLEGITSPDYVVYEPIHSESDKFLHFLLRRQEMPSVYRAISNGIRPSQWRIEPEKFEDLVLYLPTLEEQLEVVKAIQKEVLVYEQLINKCASATKLMEERKSALISAAVTGKIDVRNWQAPTSEYQTMKQTT